MSVPVSAVKAILVSAVLLGPFRVAVWLIVKPCSGHVRLEDTSWLMYRSATGPPGCLPWYSLQAQERYYFQRNIPWTG